MSDYSRRRPRSPPFPSLRLQPFMRPMLLEKPLRPGCQCYV